MARTTRAQVRSDRKPPSRRAILHAGLAAVLGLAGCGYSIRPPYDQSIRTVYVPMMRAITYRHDLNEQLTERVQKEIERRTPYKVVGKPEGADAILEGVFSSYDKNLMVENPNNLTRQLITSVFAQVRFVDNRPSAEPRKEVPYVVLPESVSFYPELGETSTLANQKAIDKMAQQIVNMMEVPW